MSTATGSNNDDLFGFTDDQFQDLAQALALAVFGPNVTPFGPGRDGGRDATFDGPALYPPAEPWNGYGVIQAKCKESTDGRGPDGAWLLGQLNGEIAEFERPDSPRKMPAYYLVITNVSLTAVPASGGRDRCMERLTEFGTKHALRGWDIWDGPKVRRLLDANAELRRTFRPSLNVGDLIDRIERLAPDTAAALPAALARYRAWLAQECGYIHLDGLPADADLSATRLRLEQLFVPLNLLLSLDEVVGAVGGELDAAGQDMRRALGENPEVRAELDRAWGGWAFASAPTLGREGVRPQRIEGTARVPTATLLETGIPLAVLGLPGAGKSTLLKRLAVAYAFPERRNESDDGLPDRTWLPVFIRCRNLRERAVRTVPELLGTIPDQVGMDDDEGTAFRAHLRAELAAGRALLLIDGLDEIAAESDRAVFAGNLRTFLGGQLRVPAVITSREVGFRRVAGVLAGRCQQVTLAPLDEADVLRLSERWHAAVVADTDEVRAQARGLAEAIWGNDRIRRLAENPLLLTTLLVVKRRGGELPRTRDRLYAEAVRVLAQTWNVEGYGHIRLDEDETLARLSYVACAMMRQAGDRVVQTIGRKRLLAQLGRAARELDPELVYTQLSPAEFVERVESRSSLLMKTGEAEIDGEHQDAFEFRHLTFQEYLAAHGFVNGLHADRPDAVDGQSIANVLAPHFDSPGWSEVIPLAAALAGGAKKAEPLIARLTAACECSPGGAGAPRAAAVPARRGAAPDRDAARGHSTGVA